MKVAVISGKGGSGKSSVTAAWLSLSRHVVAVDCDVDASNLPLLFSHEVIAHEGFVSGEDIYVDTKRCIGCGICVETCAFQALEIGTEVFPVPRDFLCEGCGCCLRVCPQHALSLVAEARSQIYTARLLRSDHHLVYGHLKPGDDNSGKMIARMREVADAEMVAIGADLQLLDGPPGIGCPVLSTLTGMDRVVLVCEPTLSGFADLQRAYRVAASFCKALFVVINKCDINSDNAQQIRDFCATYHLPVVAELPFDRKMVEAQLNCCSLVDYAPQSDGAEALRKAYALVFQ
ncbi:Cobyrinic acid ac-diamide synthase [gut metagenome]|uniref:Cobyrinic acid ac-diamide synthase n=1 Tax=gut metagenome TaxID=749906 RepID=J9GBG6_9ZZZZ